MDSVHELDSSWSSLVSMESCGGSVCCLACVASHSSCWACFVLRCTNLAAPCNFFSSFYLSSLKSFFFSLFFIFPQQTVFWYVLKLTLIWLKSYERIYVCFCSCVLRDIYVRVVVIWSKLKIYRRHLFTFLLVCKCK